jgi:16S rRNA (adenine1518-N6/adenine1519-N6)-dimethyltransferase
VATTRKYCLDNSLSLPTLDIPSLLHRYGLHPKKSLGQNFLQDDYALHQVIEAAQITPQDVVLEIGPGLGSLTRYLAVSAHTVVAVELDSLLISPLKQVVNQFPNVHVIQGDILNLDPVELVSQAEYLVVANIPYYITSALIRHLLEARRPPKRLVLTVQQAVARRICALPGGMGLLSISVQVYGQPEIIAHIPASAFFPSPKVDSTIIRIELYPSPLIPSYQLEAFFHLIKAGFSQKRKTLRNALSGGLQMSPSMIEALLHEADIDPMRRAETLDLPEWQHLTEIFRIRSSTH